MMLVFYVIQGSTASLLRVRDSPLRLKKHLDNFLKFLILQDSILSTVGNDMSHYLKYTGCTKQTS